MLTTPVLPPNQTDPDESARLPPTPCKNRPSGAIRETRVQLELQHATVLRLVQHYMTGIRAAHSFADQRGLLRVAATGIYSAFLRIEETLRSAQHPALIGQTAIHRRILDGFEVLLAARFHGESEDKMGMLHAMDELVMLQVAADGKSGGFLFTATAELPGVSGQFSTHWRGIEAYCAPRRS